MSLLYFATLSIHILAALLWLGGMFFLGAVGAPVLRSVEPAALRQQLFQQLGLRFRSIGWVAIRVLVATGALILQLRGMLRWSGVLGARGFWATAFGHARAALLARANALVGIIVVLAAVRLARG